MIKTISKIHKHISYVRVALLHFSDNLRLRAFVHDSSKFEADELQGYAKFEQMPEGLEYGSAEYKAAMSKVMEDNNCFELHSQRNDHHPEHWGNVQDMPLVPIIEMVCDWFGAHTAYGNKGGWHESVQHNIERYDFNDGQIWVIQQVADKLAKMFLQSELQE